MSEGRATADMSIVQALLMPRVDVIREAEVDPSAVEILIADDSPVSRRLLEAALRRWGYRVITASTGTDAWEVLQRPNSPRLVILDWMMPGLSGPEVCSLLRKQQQNRPNEPYVYIILLTSRNEKDDLIAGMESGADDYLVKPFDNNELKVRLGPGRRIVHLQSQLLKAQEALREQATRDDLTRLWNRHAIWEILGRELSRSGRESRPLGLIMGDLDHFKKVNDTYGHMAGDTVLREVSARLGASVRPYDSVGRYGGEEFLIILPGCDTASAQQTADRIRMGISKLPISIGNECSIMVTASFGATSLPRGIPATPEDIVRVADVALYRAKESGRDKTVCLPYPA